MVAGQTGPATISMCIFLTFLLVFVNGYDKMNLKRDGEEIERDAKESVEFEKNICVYYFHNDRFNRDCLCSHRHSGI